MTLPIVISPPRLVRVDALSSICQGFVSASPVLAEWRKRLTYMSTNIYLV